jgi:hypothetical protein
MAKKPRYKKHDWDKYREEYIYNGLSLPDLVAKYGCALSYIGKIASKENWVEQREQKRKEIKKEVERKSTQNEIDRRVAINEQHLQLFNQGLDLVVSLLEEYKEFQERRRLGVEDKQLNPVLLEKLFNCIDKGQKGQRLALGCDNKKDDEEENTPKVFYIKNLDRDKI